jgi:2-hydroxy-3-keto-5-methylthiopentenyl-1-phosphate phosphatase
MKNPNYPFGNRTRDLAVCRAVPEITAPPHTSLKLYYSKDSCGCCKASGIKAYRGLEVMLRLFVVCAVIGDGWSDVLTTSLNK